MAHAASFPYGASYSPLVFPEDDWGRDLGRMRAAHMNLVRLGDVHGSWDRIEPRPGDVRLDILQRFYAAAAAKGIGVLLSTGASSPPLWLAVQHPDVPILSSRAERYPTGASYHWACIHHPGFRQAAEAYLQRLAAFAVQQPNHFGWQISNEIGFPFLPARERQELGLYCYCPYCQKEFRAWLQQKYITTEALTLAWSWSTTSFVYGGWEEATPPESLPVSWSGVTRWIDWRLFWQEAFARFAGWQHALIRQFDADHPTSVNTFNFKGYDRFGTYMGLDVWSLATQVDHIGYDLYPGSGDKLRSRPEHNSIFLDHGRSVAQSVGSEFWIHEVESGPIGGWLLGPDHDTDERDLANYAFECLGHNGKLILYMPWREWGYQPIHWGALVDLEGGPTPRLEAAAALGAFIAEESDFLVRAAVPAGEVGLIESKPNAIFFRGTDQEEVLFDAQRGAYAAFWEQGFGVDFVRLGRADPARLAQYRCLVLPQMGLMSEGQARELEAYVLQGGILIGFSRCAALDERGWYQPALPVAAFRSAFGIKSLRPGVLAEDRVRFQGAEFPAWRNRDLLEPQEATEVLAVFDDGAPAVTLARCGRGAGLYFATQADAGQLHARPALLGAVLSELQDRFGLSPRCQTISPDGRARGVDHHVLEADSRSLTLFSNYSPQDNAARFSIRLDGRVPDRVHSVFPVRQPVRWEVDARYLHLPLDFHRREVKAIEIIWR